jgi:hypothetical protein
MRIDWGISHRCFRRSSAQDGVKCWLSRREGRSAKRSCTTCTFVHERDGNKAMRPRNRLTRFSLARKNLALREEIRDFLRCCFRGVGAVNCIRVDRVGEIGANGARRGLFRIGGAHQVAVF